MANKVFLDTNIILNDLFDDRECSKVSQELLDKYLKEDTVFVINDLSLNNLFYIGAKKDFYKIFNFMKDISFNNPMWEVYTLTNKDYKEIYDFMDKNDYKNFEDLQQYIAARNCGCKFIITNGNDDFPKLDIPLIRTNPKFENYTPENKTENTQAQEKKGVVDNIINFVRKNK